jgi:hypothetical protein
MIDISKRAFIAQGRNSTFFIIVVVKFILPVSEVLISLVSILLWVIPNLLYYGKPNV